MVAGCGNLNVLPLEIVELILDQVVAGSKKNKNDVLPLRAVCKQFDAVLRPKLFKTIQLDFDRLSKNGHRADLKYLSGVGDDIKALVLQLSAVRSETEVKDLRAAFSSITGRVPDTKRVLENLNLRRMGEETFDETDFKDLVCAIFEKTRNLSKLKVNLPFKIVGQAPIHATTLFANILECISSRNEEHLAVETLVLGHLSDTTLNKIYGNPMDLKNALAVFKPLKHLIINAKRQEYDNASQASFQAGFWRLISEARDLRSLCITGWNSNRVDRQRASQGTHRVEREKWASQCLPYRSLSDGRVRLMHIQFLELKRVDIEPRALMQMLAEFGRSLKELYLNQTFLKHDQQSMPHVSFLWIGHGADVVKGAGDLWIADEIKKMMQEKTLNLRILRASAIGYDYINPAQGANNTFDLEDASDLGRSFDERFVQRAMNLPSPVIGGPAVPVLAYDCRTSLVFHNPTSVYSQTLDGEFCNYSTDSVADIEKIIKIVDDSMKKLTSQLENVNRAGDGKPPSANGDHSDSDEEMTDA